MLMVILVLAFLVAVNILINKLPTGWVSYDISDVKLFSIGDKTREVAKSLDKDVTIYLIGETGNYDYIITQMLKLYEDQSSKIHVKNLDVNRNFATLREYGLEGETIDNGSILVVSDLRSKFIPESDIYELDVAKFAQSQYQTKYYNYDGEGEVTSALVYVTTSDIPKIYKVVGHNEDELGEIIMASIKKANYDIADINLMSDTIANDCDILLINSPQNDYTQMECDLIRDYVDHGGKIMISCAYENAEKTENFRNLLVYLGIELKTGVVCEQSDRTLSSESPYMYLANVSTSSSLTKEMSQNSYVFVSVSTGLYTAETKKKSLTLSPFLQTTSGSFQCLDLAREKFVQKTGDISGPITIGLTGEDSLSGMKMVVFGSNRLVDNALLEAYPNILNGDLYIAALNYLCSFDRSVSIPVKVTDFGKNLYMMSNRNMALVISAVILPITVLLIGFIVWYRRRNR